MQPDDLWMLVRQGVANSNLEMKNYLYDAINYSFSETRNLKTLGLIDNSVLINIEIRKELNGRNKD